METHTAVIDSFLEFADLSKRERDLLKKELTRYIEERVGRGGWYHPMITKFHTDWYRELYRLAGKEDPYREVKETSNKVAERILGSVKPRGMRDILLLTILGNIVDFGACVTGVYDVERLEEDVRNLRKERLDFDDTAELTRALRTARTVFYLFDNCGEMIFDRLLLDEVRKHVPKGKVFLVANETPMLNDVTVADLRTHGFAKYGRIVSKGSNCFGLHEEDVSPEFKRIFRTADLVIAKGQAYFEFFMEYNFPNVFNVLRVKQEIKGRNIPTLRPGMNVVMSSKRYVGEGVDYVWDEEEE